MRACVRSCVLFVCKRTVFFLVLSARALQWIRVHAHKGSCPFPLFAGLWFNLKFASILLLLLFVFEAWKGENREASCFPVGICLLARKKKRKVGERVEEKEAGSLTELNAITQLSWLQNHGSV